WPKRKAYVNTGGTPRRGGCARISEGVAGQFLSGFCDSEENASGAKNAKDIIGIWTGITATRATRVRTPAPWACRRRVSETTPLVPRLPLASRAGRWLEPPQIARRPSLPSR